MCRVLYAASAWMRRSGDARDCLFLLQIHDPKKCMCTKIVHESGVCSMISWL